MPSREWREKHKHPCKRCGQLVHYGSVYCKRCAALERAKNPEYIKKQSISHRGNKGRLGQKRSPEEIAKVKAKWTPEKRQKARLRALKYKYDPEWIEKVSNFGEKNPMWRGGIARSKYKRFYQTLKEEIKKRDEHKCQLCGMTEEESVKQIGHKLGVHHIDYDKTNASKKNLITLCNKCNSKVNYRREKWKKHFQEKIASIYGIEK